MSERLILVTNDDGIQSEGIDLLATVASTFWPSGSHCT